MCGIVGVVAQRNVSPVLLEGLKRLEYLGYDSAGIAVINAKSGLERVRTQGKVNLLSQSLAKTPIQGDTGIAHTRWATHGRPSVDNAHPHICRNEVALVHNGIIENHEQLRDELGRHGYEPESDTDTEVIVNQVHYFLSLGKDLLQAVMETTCVLDGAYALGVVYDKEPGRLVAARHNSPLRYWYRGVFHRFGHIRATVCDTEIHHSAGRGCSRYRPEQRYHIRPPGQPGG